MVDQREPSPDRVYGMDEFLQFDRLNKNTNNRIPIFFCVDTSASMQTRISFSETRISLLSKVMMNLMRRMKSHPILGERAVVGIVTYNNIAVLHQSANDLSIINIESVTKFITENNTVFSRGLKRSLQAIDQYRDSLLRSDVSTATPILVFMTDGMPVGDSDMEIQNVCYEIHNRINNNDLIVFSIGISREANMRYVRQLTPSNTGYQIVSDAEFVNIFNEIEKIIDGIPPDPQDDVERTRMVSTNKGTMDTGTGNHLAFEALVEKRILANH